MYNDNSVFKYNIPNLEWTIPCQFQYEPVFGAIQSSLMELGFEPIKANTFGAPATIWSGGRKPSIYGELSNKELEKRFEYLTSFNGIPTFTFTCTCVEEEHIQDKYANRIIDVAKDFNARYIVFSDALKDHIRKKVPGAQIVSSVVKAICHFQGVTRKENPTPENESRYYNEMLKEYDVVVVRPEYSKTVLTTTPEMIDDLSRIEVMINQMCFSSCPNAPLHSRTLEKQRVKPGRMPEFICPKHRLPLCQQYKTNSSHTYEDVVKILNAGVRNLKLQGRGEDVPYLSTLIGLSSQIMRFDGPNNILIKKVLPEKLNIELEHFDNMINQIRKEQGRV